MSAEANALAEWRRDMEQVAARLFQRAMLTTFDGRTNARNRAYMDYCTFVHEPTATAIILTRDTGHHTSGWMKNPQYERCWHLSLSVRRNRPPAVEPTREVLDAWVDIFFASMRSFVWAESAKSPEGQRLGVEHYRVFCDSAWQPIVPRGEVYATRWTAADWKSSSQRRAEEGVEIESSIDPN